MVEKVIISPEEVRGGGNIISPAKNSSDYSGYLSNISESSETVNGLPIKVFDLTLNANSIGRFSINGQGHLMFTLEGDSNITFSINNNGHLIVSGTTEREYHIDSNGHCVYGA